MKDGFYLAAYLSVHELAYLFDIKLRHDQNISLWKKMGNALTLVHYWELERLTGMKKCKRPFRDKEQVQKLILNLLSSYGLKLSDIQGIWGIPELSSDFRTEQEPGQKIPWHSLYHLYSGLLMDSHLFYSQDMVVLAVDGGPDSLYDGFKSEDCLFFGCRSNHGKVSYQAISSPGPLWSSLAIHYGMQEGALMALGSASNSRLLYKIDDMPVLTVRTFKDIWRVKAWIEVLIETVMSFEKEDEGIKFNEFDSRFSKRENCISMVVKVIQNISLKIMRNNVQILLEGDRPDKYYLSITGGYALNCPTNSYLQEWFQMKGFSAPPCVSDCGMSLGIALYEFYRRNSQPIQFQLLHPGYGDYDDLESVQHNFRFYIADITPFDDEKFVQDLEKAPVIWFNGRAEIGPRALGNRCILADPRNSHMKDRINEIKQRQWWRPVSPIILTEYLNDWYLSDKLSPFMLKTYVVRTSKQRLIPAALHMDGTSRIQSLSMKDNADIYRAVLAYYKKTQIPLICNTSLNDRGEPIINTVEEALNFALRKRIEVIYVNMKRIRLEFHEKYCVKQPLTRKFADIYELPENLETLQKQSNPHNLDYNILKLYFLRPVFGLDIDITDAKMVQLIKTYILRLYQEEKNTEKVYRKQAECGI